MAIERKTLIKGVGYGYSEGDECADADVAVKPVTRLEAQDLRRRKGGPSPWRVVAAQAAVGAAVALIVALATDRQAAGWSALYGAAAVVLPGALMARGMTSRLTSLSPGISAGSFMGWESIKVAVSVSMLVVAPRIVWALNWPALLAGLVLCMQVYWLALLWPPGRKK
jgi:ATP synthase protein I